MEWAAFIVCLTKSRPTSDQLMPNSTSSPLARMQISSWRRPRGCRLRPDIAAARKMAEWMNVKMIVYRFINEMVRHLNNCTTIWHVSYCILHRHYTIGQPPIEFLTYYLLIYSGTARDNLTATTRLSVVSIKSKKHESQKHYCSEMQTEIIVNVCVSDYENSLTAVSLKQREVCQLREAWRRSNFSGVTEIWHVGGWLFLLHRE